MFTFTSAEPIINACESSYDMRALMLMSMSVKIFSVAKIANYCIDHEGVVRSEDNVRKKLAKKKFVRDVHVLFALNVIGA